MEKQRDGLMETYKLYEKKSASALEKKCIKKIRENIMRKKRESKRDVCVEIETKKDLLRRKFGIELHESFYCF